MHRLKMGILLSSAQAGTLTVHNPPSMRIFYIAAQKTGLLLHSMLDVQKYSYHPHTPKNHVFWPRQLGQPQRFWLPRLAPCKTDVQAARRKECSAVSALFCWFLVTLMSTGSPVRAACLCYA